MQAFFAPEQMKHDPQQFMWEGRITRPKDVKERTDALLAALHNMNVPVAPPEDFGLEAIRAAHDADYLEFLATAWAQWQTLTQPGIEVLPSHSPYYNAHPSQLSRGACRPSAPVARAGFYLGDLSSPMGPHTWQSALRSAHSAVAAAHHVMAGADSAYALCRPSGHHVKYDCAAGFCYLNNTAIVAQALRKQFARVAVIDVDVHHGDGTQQIFYSRNDVLTVSLHADTTTYYPFFTGYADETGYGPGQGYNLNLPLSHGMQDDAWLQHFDDACTQVTAFAPDALVIALGFDAHHADPLGVLNLTDDCFHATGRRVQAFDLQTVLVQEGGYGVDTIGNNLQAFLEGFLNPQGAAQ